MPNVFFKKGTQAQFNAKTSGWQAGAFYLTTDTQRLYYSDNGGAPVQINPGITKVAAIANLPSSNQISAADYGQFYYCKAENVLAIYDPSQGTTGGWVQINAYEDTVIDQRTITSSNSETAATKTSANVVSIVDVLYQNDTSKGGDTLQQDIEIAGANGLIASVAQKYEPAKAFHAGVNYYTKSGNTYTKVAAPTAANVSTYYVEGGYKLTLTAPTYSLSSSVAKSGDADVATITLGGASANNTVTLKSGNNVSLTKTGNDVVISAADAVSLASVTGAAATGTGKTGFDITVAMGNGDSQTGNINPVIKLDKTVVESASGYKFSGGELKLPVYSKSEVDKKIEDFNAMEYKGVLTSATAVTNLLSATNLKNGWVYMLSSDADLYINSNRQILKTGTTQQQISATSGDLIVVQGTEGANGFIATPTLVHVPSGNDHDTTYTFTKDTHGITIANDQGSTVGGLKLNVADSDYITLTDDTNSSAKERTVTIAHKTTTINTAAAGTASATQDALGDLAIVVPTVTFDNAGHATAVTNKTYNVTDTHNNLDSVTVGVAVVNNVATVTDTVAMTDGEDSSGSFSLSSDNLKVSATANAIVMNLEWETF